MYGVTVQQFLLRNTAAAQEIALPAEGAACMIWLSLTPRILRGLSSWTSAHRVVVCG